MSETSCTKLSDISPTHLYLQSRTNIIEKLMNNREKWFDCDVDCFTISEKQTVPDFVVKHCDKDDINFIVFDVIDHEDNPVRLSDISHIVESISIYRGDSNYLHNLITIKKDHEIHLVFVII